MSAYQVLARKYRPQQFLEVVGQGHIVKTLENAIQQKRIAHAYLFVGPRGTGKTTLARIFAKSLNCSGSKDPTIKPCDVCSNCKEITMGSSMDVMEIDGASNNGVDQVRELREIVRYAPSSARFKIIYIDEVHMLSVAAFNALLKTLEEPPAHVKFLFATTDPQKIPLTILSRCQRFDLHRISNDLIVQHLGKISKLEKVEISDAALLAIARGASGGMRDAESALDQLIAFCGSKIEEADVLSIFGLAARDQIRQLIRGVLSGDRAVVVQLASQLSEEGKDLGKLLGELIESFRNILVLQAGAEVSDATAEETVELKQYSQELHRARTLRVLEILTEAENQMRWTLSKKILFEVTILKAIETKDEVLLEEVLKKLKGMASSGDLVPARKLEVPSVVAAVAEKAAPAKMTQVVPKAAPAPTPAPVPTPELKSLWKDILDYLAKPYPMVKSALVEGIPISLTEDTLVIGFDPEFELQKELIETPKNKEVLQAKLRELTHKAMTVRVVFANDPSIPEGGDSNVEPDTKSRVPDAGRFDEDPLIHKALEIFKGQIVEIRR
jgi:DNA polymerase III subunit gamma/tau